MLVKFVAFYRFLIAFAFALFAIVPVYAEGTNNNCEPTEKFYNGVAQQVLAKLNELNPKLEIYNNLLQQSVFDPSGSCYLLNSQVEQSNTEPYNWSGSDLSGISLAGKEYRDEIKNILKSMDMSKTDIDFAPYDYKNDSRISSANIAIKVSKDEAKKVALMQDLAIYKQCKADLFNLSQQQSDIKDRRSNISSYLTTLANPQATNCACDENGIKSCSTVTETAEEEAAKDLSCKNLNEYTQDTAFCPTCVIFERVLMADQKLARGAFGVLAGSLIKVLGIAFLIFLAYQTLILVSAPSNQPMSKYLTTVVTQGFKVAVAVLILSNPSFLYNLALKPIIEGSLDFGITLTGKSQAVIEQAGNKYTKFDTTDSLLSAPFLQKMVGAADVFNEQAALMPAMGRSLICNAFEDLDWFVIPNIETLFEGFMVLIFGYMISLSVGFYLLDITLELGFICCLLPFLIACWPFKITSKYTKVGWGIFMHIFFTFVMLGVVITTINAIIKRGLSPNHDVQELISALNDNDMGLIKKIMEFGGSQLLFLIVSCYICLKLLKDINNLANKFAGGAGFNISPSVGGLAASTMFASGVNGGKSIFKGLSAGAEGVKAIGEASGVNGALKAGANKASDVLGFNKMRQYYGQLKNGNGNKATEEGKSQTKPQDNKAGDKQQ